MAVNAESIIENGAHLVSLGLGFTGIVAGIFTANPVVPTIFAGLGLAVEGTTLIIKGAAKGIELANNSKLEKDHQPIVQADNHINPAKVSSALFAKTSMPAIAQQAAMNAIEKETAAIPLLKGIAPVA